MRTAFRSEAGFGLMESIVALAIAALALSALYRLQAGAVQAAGRARLAEAALQYARSHLDGLGADGTLHSGSSNGNYGMGLHWQLIVSPLSSNDAAPETEKPYWLDLRTLDSAGRLLLQLETARIAREAQ